jgi:hypothetical protein
MRRQLPANDPLRTDTRWDVEELRPPPSDRDPADTIAMGDTAEAARSMRQEVDTTATRGVKGRCTLTSADHGRHSAQIIDPPHVMKNVVGKTIKAMKGKRGVCINDHDYTIATYTCSIG